MRVLLASHVEVASGGAELALLELVGALARHRPDVQCEVLVPNRGPLGERLAAIDIRTHLIAHPWWTMWPPIAPVDRARRLAEVLSAARALTPLIRQTRADLIVTNSLVAPAPALGAALIRVPHVWQVQEFGRRDHGLAYVLGEAMTYRLIHRLSRVVVVPSRAVGYALGGVTTEIPYAVMGRWDDLPRLDDAHPAPRAHVVALVGHRKPSKGQADAIAALGLLQRDGLRPRLRLVGQTDPGYDNALLTMAQRLGVAGQVELVPPTDDLAAIYHGAGIALMCSRSEALGRVTVEAMKAGVPVVGADSGATPDLLADGRGQLYPPGDVGALADRIRVLLADPAIASAQGLRAQTWARKRFSAHTYAAETVAAWERALG